VGEGMAGFGGSGWNQADRRRYSGEKGDPESTGSATEGWLPVSRVLGEKGCDTENASKAPGQLVRVMAAWRRMLAPCRGWCREVSDARLRQSGGAAAKRWAC